MVKDNRPDPDALLRTIQPGEPRRRGRLKLFFGACAGVGKTYAMLSAAQEKHNDGVDVLVGLVETHGRIETEELVRGLKQLPRLSFDHRGVTLTEFDLEAALKAKPTLLLVDELAHSNAPGARHPKRWMDIEELLEAGIDVYTTLNVQHVESLNDIVAGTTGIRVQETVPDGVFDKADDITLVDIPSDDLLERLREGKVYITDLGKKRAAENFFRRENLLALRELALRRVAERLDAQSTYGRTSPDINRRTANERLAVCIGPGDLTPHLLRATKRLADGLRASWVALYIENARHYRLSHAAQLKLERNLRLAEEMGGKTEIIQGDNAANAILHYAQNSGITKIVAGKPPKSFWRDLWQGSLVNQLIRDSGVIDVYIVTGHDQAPAHSIQELRPPSRQWGGYVAALVSTALITLAGIPLHSSVHSENLVMLYILSIILLATRYGWAVSSTASIFSFVTYNYFFTEPLYSLQVSSLNDMLTLTLLLVTGFFAGLQTSTLQAQSRFFRRKERTTSTLYAMSQEMANTRQQNALFEVIQRHLELTMDGNAIIWFPDAHGDLEPALETMHRIGVKEEVAIRWVMSNNQPAGLGTTTMPSAHGYFLPLRGSSGAFGVLGIIPRQQHHLFTQEDKDMLETFASLGAAALERVSVTEIAEERKVEAERERLRNALLSSVSHDLRTPLASIKGAIGSLLIDNGHINTGTRQELLTSAHDEVSRLERVVSNLLDVTRLESGEIKLRRDYYFVPELAGNAIGHVSNLLKHHLVETDIEDDLPAIWVDGLLIEQVLVNLLENAAKYTPPRTTVRVVAKKLSDARIEITVEDNGSGIPQRQEEHIFDKFTSFAQEQQTYGTGLGLTICRGILKAHGGTITATNGIKGGARFTFTIPAASALPINPDEKYYGNV